jgi:3-hydroxyisobutyrate dehydrogenase
MATMAVLGTGLMGAALTQAALGRGETVAVWNRTKAKTEPLAALGARVAETPGQASQGAQFVHVFLQDDASVDAALEGLHLEPGAVLLDHTTTSPQGTRARAEVCERRGLAFLHAPVFMAPQNCRTGTGLMLCSGPQSRFEQVQAHLQTLTGEVWWLGERPDLAACVKLMGNASILTAMAGLADVFAMASAQDVPLEQCLELFRKFKPNAVFDVRGPKMARGDFTPSFHLTTARKDVRLMVKRRRGRRWPCCRGSPRAWTR